MRKNHGISNLRWQQRRRRRMRKYFWETYTMTRYVAELNREGEVLAINQQSWKSFSHKSCWPVHCSVKISFGHQEFLREVYEKCEDNKELQEKSEEGFLFLTDRSTCSFWRRKNVTIRLLRADQRSNCSFVKVAILFLCPDRRCGGLRSQCMWQKGKKLPGSRGSMSTSELGANPSCQSPSRRGLHICGFCLMFLE